MRGAHVTHLVSECGRRDDYAALRLVHALLDADFFVGHAGNVIVRNALMRVYVRGAHWSDALTIAHTIPEQRKDAISHSLAMQAFIGSDAHSRALDIFCSVAAAYPNDDILDVLALKACTNTADDRALRIGQQLHRKHCDTRNVRLRCALLEMHTHHHNMSDAEALYASIPSEAPISERAVCGNALMTAWLRQQCAEKALALYARNGAGPWPHCGVYLQ